MADERGKVNVAILAVPEIAASTVIGMVDLFASVGRDWPFLVNGTFGEARIRPYIVSARPEGFRAANNVWVKPDFTLEECPAPAIVCVPDLFIAPGKNCAGRYEREVAWLRKCHRAGATSTRCGSRRRSRCCRSRNCRWRRSPTRSATRTRASSAVCSTAKSA